MGRLADDLDELGYEPTDRESPFDDAGSLWTNSYELVCDETGFVIEKDNRSPDDTGTSKNYVEYNTTSTVRMVGGFADYHRGDGIY